MESKNQKSTDIKVENANCKKKKKNVLLYIIIFILVICLCTTSTILFLKKDVIVNKTSSDKNNVNTSKESYGTPISGPKSEDTDEEINLGVDSDLATMLFDAFKFEGRIYLTVDGLNNDNKVKLRLAYEMMPQNKIGTISCDDAIIESGRMCGDDDRNSTNGTSFTKKVSESDISRYVRLLFGSDVKFNNETFGVGLSTGSKGPIMYYDSNSKNYYYSGYNGGGTRIGSSQSLESATKKGDIITLKTKLTKGDSTSNVIYTFKKDKVNYNYVFDNIKES